MVEDEAITRAKLVGYFQHAGYRVSEAENKAQMNVVLENNHIDLVMLDINLPDEDGLMITRNLRSHSDIGIVLVTGRTDSIDKIIGLEMGADDYIAKPCDPRELIARIRAVTRRTTTAPAAPTTNSTTADDDTIKLDDVTIMRMSRQVLLNNESLEFTSAEFDLLLVLIDKAGTLVTREMLSKEGLGKRLKRYDRSIDVHVSNLRKKLGTDSHGRERIKTVHGGGYLYVIYPNE